jgi:IS30 family transposase
MSEFARKPAESSHALHTVSGPSAGPAIELAREKHYSIIEIAEALGTQREDRSQNIRKGTRRDSLEHRRKVAQARIPDAASA